MKKVIALLSALLLLCGLAACKQEPADPAAALVGSWEATIDLAPYLEERIEADENKLKDRLDLSTCPAKVTYTFAADGSVQRVISGAFGEEALAKLTAEVEAGYTAYYERYIKVNKVDMTLEEFQEATGISIPRKAAKIADAAYLEALVDEIEYNGSYQVQEQALLIRGNTDADGARSHIFAIEEGTLTFSAVGNPSAFERLYYPLTLG